MTTTIYLFTATGGEGEHYTIEACAVTDGEYMPRQCGSTPSVDHATAPIQSVGGSGLSQRVAHNLHVRIVNNTSREIIALLASPTANDKWHANMIPNGQALAPGKWIDANFDDGSGRLRFEGCRCCGECRGSASGERLHDDGLDVT
jgi:hypothetical protein